MVGTARIDEGAENAGNERSLRLAWAAGFIDGEGCILIARATGERGPLKHENSKRWYRLCIQVAQCSRAPLLVLQELFGGTIFEKSVKNERSRPAYEWRVSAGKAKDVLKELLPYFVQKIDEAKVGIRFREEQEANFDRKDYRLTDGMLQRYEQYHTELRKLHHRVEG